MSDSNHDLARTTPARAIARFGLLVALAVTGVVLMRWTPLGEHLTKDGVLALLNHLRHAWWAPPALVLAYVVASPLALPVSPLMIGGGAVFGAWLGTLLNILGLVLGGGLSYFAGKHLGRDLLLHIAGQRLKKAEKILEKQSFWPLLQVRYLPIPFAAVNYGAALAGISTPRFLSTLVIGLIPATTVHTCFAAALIARPSSQILWFSYAATMVAFNLLLSAPWIRERWQRKKRYQELLERRSRREPRDDV